MKYLHDLLETSREPKVIADRINTTFTFNIYAAEDPTSDLSTKLHNKGSKRQECWKNCIFTNIIVQGPNIMTRDDKYLPRKKAWNRIRVKSSPL